jgi:tetratricopeptide (TPR) repeat protein
LYTELADANPHVVEYRRSLAVCYGAMAFLSGLEESIPYHRKALAIRQEIVREHPSDVIARNDLARTYGNIAAVLRNLAQPEQSLAAYDSAAAIGEKLVAMPLDTVSTAVDFTRRGNPWANVREDLARIHQNRSDVLRDLGRRDEAAAAWERSYELIQGLLARYPASLDNQNMRAWSEFSGGMVRTSQQRYDDAEVLLLRAEQAFAELAAENPQMAIYQTNLGETQFQLVELLNLMGRRAQAFEVSQRAVSTLERVLAQEPNAGRRTLYARALRQQSEILTRDGRDREALTVLRKARTIQEEALASEPESVYHKSSLATLLQSLGRAALATGERDEAREAFQRSAEVTAEYAAKYPGQRYNQACSVALMVPLCPSAARDSVEAEAMALLRQAVDAGYHEYDHMAKDSDLDALRGRADFRELMARRSTK